MNDQKAKVLKNLILRSKYFQNHRQNNILFEPEFETSKIINKILKEEELSDADAAEVINIISDIDKAEHFDGSGWADYIARLRHFFTLCGYQIEISEGKMYLK